MDFQSFNLPALILNNLKTAGYHTPTPIQEKTLPAILEGRDLVGLAQTGTGKTLAFILPILQRLLNSPVKPACIRALVMAPTRELANQINEEFIKFSKGSNLRSVVLYGGVDIKRQIYQLNQGAHIVIACPGRLVDHIKGKEGKTSNRKGMETKPFARKKSINLKQVEMVVLDEADHMLDLGFIDDIKTILKELPTKRQSLLFSATMSSEIPEISELTQTYLHNPLTVSVNPTVSAPTITQGLYPTPEKLKTDLLVQLLTQQEIESAIIFTRTKARSQELTDQLNNQGLKAGSFQSNLTQSKREFILQRFRKGKINLLVATDIASRGIDVPHVSHVINFDMPNTPEIYTHRIGRTGRANQAGTAFSFITRADEHQVRMIEKQKSMKLDRHYLPDFDYKNKNPVLSIYEQHDPSKKMRSFERSFQKKEAPKSRHSATPSRKHHFQPKRNNPYKRREQNA